MSWCVGAAASRPLQKPIAALHLLQRVLKSNGVDEEPPVADGVAQDAGAGASRSYRDAFAAPARPSRPRAVPRASIGSEEPEEAAADDEGGDDDATARDEALERLKGGRLEGDGIDYDVEE